MENRTASMQEAVGVDVSIHGPIKELAFKMILLSKTPKANQSRRNCLQSRRWGRSCGLKYDGD